MTALQKSLQYLLMVVGRHYWKYSRDARQTYSRAFLDYCYWRMCVGARRLFVGKLIAFLGALEEAG